MQLIKNNPFRLLGLPANASERELQKQLSIIKRFVEVKQNRSFDYDFTFLGPLIRNESSVQEAANKIEQSTNRVFYGLHWFINYNHIDETAVEYLRQNNIDKAIEIWEKLVNSSQVNESNFNAYSNLSTIILGYKCLNGTVSIENLEKGMELKLSLMSSKAFNKFLYVVGGDLSNADADYYIDKFINEVLNILIGYSKKNKINLKQIVDIFSKLPGNVERIALEKFTSEPFRKIENKVENTIQERKQDPKNGKKLGEKLFMDCRDELHYLKNIIGNSNLKYQTIANKVASEILQCSIEFFNVFQDDKNFDPGDDCYRLIKYADSIAVNGSVKHKIREGLEFLIKWEKEKPSREIFNKISDEVEFIINRIESIRYPKLSDAMKTLELCGPKLIKMKNKLGGASSMYLQWCDVVVGNVMGMAVTIFNKEVQANSVLHSPTSELKNITYQVYTLLKSLESYDMSYDLRTRLTSNLETLKITNDKLNPSGCFIATLVYGNYEHPQVKILRAFRDNTLMSTSIGRKIVDLYYMLSPTIVNKLQSKTVIQKLVRSSLNLFIKVIK